MKLVKSKAKKIAIAAAAASILSGVGAVGASSAAAGWNDGEIDCPCPWWFRLPGGSCMIQQLCDDGE